MHPLYWIDAHLEEELGRGDKFIEAHPVVVLR